jgi:hypothetical protein
MIRYAEKENVRIEHIIAPQTAHKVKTESKPEIEAAMASAIAKGVEHFPKHVRFTTYSLIYPSMEWLTVVGMDKQWERADVDATVAADKLSISTKNVNELLLAGPFGEGVEEADRIKTAVIDGDKVAVQGFKAGVRFHKADGHWHSGPSAGLYEPNRKTSNVCGPIDHAFMSSFVMVRPTGKPLNETVGGWAAAELDHATTFWRKVFRGDAPVKDDSAVSPEDISKSNLVLWGDPSSNTVLAKILPKLPIKWDAGKIEFGGKTYDAANHAPILIFPNPLNPEKYVVINSGVTFREEALLNNAQQTPKLPDWAIVDLRTAPGPLSPGLIEQAGFFNEKWQAAVSK